MFTGLIQDVGRLRARHANTLEVETGRIWSELAYGESIAVNGVCLTLERSAGRTLTFHTLDETLKRSNLGTLASGAKVNLERALRLGDALGGHLVSGHVDGTGTVRAWRNLPGGDLELEVRTPEELLPLIAVKGSIAVDGISLTVVKVLPDAFTVNLIPVTRQETALAERAAGDPVNLECDLLARYVARQLAFAAPNRAVPEQSSRITMEMLKNAGF